MRLVINYYTLYNNVSSRANTLNSTIDSPIAIEIISEYTTIMR